MRRDANLYTRRNRQKIKAVAKQLTQPGHLFRLNSVRRFFQDPVARQLFMDEVRILVGMLNPKRRKSLQNQQ
jgi:hypothetical protein